jgi:hypothetical protein
MLPQITIEETSALKPKRYHYRYIKAIGLLKWISLGMITLIT